MSKNFNNLETAVFTSLQQPTKQRKYKKDYPVKKIYECNLCGRHFSPQSRYERFCQKCRDESELFQSYEWN